MGNGAEAHGIPSPGKILPDGPAVAARLYDHVVLALVNTDMIDVAAQVRCVMEKHQVTRPRLRMRFPMEFMELIIGRPPNPQAITVPVGILGEPGAIHTSPRGTAPHIRHPLQRNGIPGDPYIRGGCMCGRWSEYHVRSYIGAKWQNRCKSGGRTGDRNTDSGPRVKPGHSCRALPSVHVSG